MRQNAPQRRGRGRPSGRRGFNNSPNRSYDSSGPEVKIRGTASTVYDKYQTLGRDAVLSGDRVAAENYFQHAEHYYRLVQAAKPQAGENEQRDVRRQEQPNRGERGNERAAAGDEQSAVVAEEAVVEIAGDGRGNDTDDVGTADREHSGTGDALTGEASAVTADEARGTPMNPADLAAMSERGDRTGNGAHRRDKPNRGGGDQDDNGAENVEAAPRRQPRRRRRPAADATVEESDGAPVDVPEDVESS